MASRELSKEMSWIGIALLVMWLVWIVDTTIPFSMIDYGLQPRRLAGLLGILTMPFLHGSFGHLLGNSISLAILLALLISSQKSPWVLTLLTTVISGVLLWLIGRNANHIGASGLVFGLIGLLIVSGFMQRRLLSVAVAILVGILFGGTLLWGLTPLTEGVSWDGHLCGLLSGIIVAFLYGDKRIRKQLIDDVLAKTKRKSAS